MNDMWRRFKARGVRHCIEGAIDAAVALIAIAAIIAAVGYAGYIIGTFV